jgi:sulfur-oxidizing protein SoxB
MGLAGAAGIFPRAGFAAGSDDSKLYDVPAFGNARILHFTDCHAQLNPIYFREPDVNLGIGAAYGKPPHLVGNKLLEHFGIAGGGIEEHAYTYLNFEEAARMFGKVGGFAHLATLVKKLRAEYAQGRSLLLDGGDTWQGSGTAYWTRGRDMVEACNLLGVDVMTGHWEFTYLAEEVLENAGMFAGEFVSQNCKVREDALFGSSLTRSGKWAIYASPWSASPFRTRRSPIRSALSPTGPSASMKEICRKSSTRRVTRKTPMA